MDRREEGFVEGEGAGVGEGGKDLGSVGVADQRRMIVKHLKGLDNLQLGMLIAVAPRLCNMVGEPGVAVVFEEDGAYYLEYDPNVIEWDGDTGHLAAKA